MQKFIRSLPVNFPSRLPALVAGLCALTLAGCGSSRDQESGSEVDVGKVGVSKVALAERDELSHDLTRFAEHALNERRELADGFDRFARTAGMDLGQSIACDTKLFLRWRKREWWRLQDDFAATFQLRWREVERLSADIGRYYGYNIQNFPQTSNDVANFLVNADPEWRNLVLDVAVFLEYENREIMPLSVELRDFYRQVDWEIANAQIDVKSFLEWREREYKKLSYDAADFWRQGGEEYDKLVLDLHRYAEERLPEGHLMLMDFSNFFTNKTSHEVARMKAGLGRFASFKRREWWRLQSDFQRWFA